MKPAYFQSANHNRDRWMVSYLDVLTILLILFVAMAAKSLHDAPVKMAQTAPLPAPLVTPGPSSTLGSIERQLESYGLDVRVDARGVVVSLPQALLFAPGEDRISSKAFDAVRQIGGVLSQIPNPISLVGHADTVPIHNHRFKSNWELAAARGLRLLELLSEQYGVAPSRLSLESDGSNDPRSSNETPDGRASNRRVEIVIRDIRATPGA